MLPGVAFPEQREGARSMPALRRCGPLLLGRPVVQATACGSQGGVMSACTQARQTLAIATVP